MSWWTRPEIRCSGSALFRGTIPPRAENFDYLEKLGCSLTPEPPQEDEHWRLAVSHPKWGNATLFCLRRTVPPPDPLVDIEHRLSAEEKERAKLARSAVSVSLVSRDANLLKERKRMLWFLRALLSDDGVAALDHVAQAFWSPVGLEEELSHDAALDILALFTIHSVVDTEGRAYWVHTHGLKEIGFFDMDVLYPHPDSLGPGLQDLFRALAFSIVEGKAELKGAPYEVFGGAPPLVFIPARDFQAEQGDNYPLWARELDDEHGKGHGVICAPPRKRLFGLLRTPVDLWPVLREAIPEDIPMLFSDSSTDLMAERARSTWSVLRSLREEFAELELPCLVKMRGCPEVSEHLWFEVHNCGDDRVDATLLNDPWNDIGYQRGDRRERPLELLTDWVMMTPAGRISPRSVVAARTIRENLEEIKAALQRHRAAQTPEV